MKAAWRVTVEAAREDHRRDVYGVRVEGDEGSPAEVIAKAAIRRAVKISKVPPGAVRVLNTERVAA